MRGKKFLIIPALLMLYFLLLPVILTLDLGAGYGNGQTDNGGGSLTIGFGDRVTISVTRAYFFGLIRLPVYSSAYGSIAWMHEAFFYSLTGLTFVLIALEAIGQRKGNIKRYNIHREELKMPRFGKKNQFTFDWKKLLKAVALGLGLGFLTLLFSNDPGIPVAVMLMVIYLQYKFK